MTKIQLVQSLRPEVRPEPKTDMEFALYALHRDIEHLRLQLELWQERCHQKNVMLADEAEFLSERLETGEAVSVEAMKRRISRLRGALHKFEKMEV